MTVNFDGYLENADWTKTSADVDLLTRAGLDAYLAEHKMSVEHFKSLPVYRANSITFDALLKDKP